MFSNFVKVLCASFIFITNTFAQNAVGVATWNVGWLMDMQTHEQWVKGCQSVSWQTESELRAAGKTMPPELVGLPYCDVHDGIDFRKKSACLQSMGPQARSRPNALDSADGKCRVSPDLADRNNYDLKIRALRETFASMDKDGVTLIAFQEVTGDDAIKLILPEGWEVKTSASISGAPKIPQHVGVAWKKAAHSLQDFRLLMALSSIGSRPLRPGLQFRFSLGGAPIDGLVVHMKAGCRSSALNKPKNDAESDACPVLQQQVPVIEKWIDDRVGQSFMVLGDFNRSLLKELETFPQPDPKQFGLTATKDIQWIAPEWNDNVPNGSLVTVVPYKKKADGSLIAGDFFCAQTTGIDHVILSKALMERIKPTQGPLELLPVTYRFDGKRLPVSKSTVPPSDHCARFVRFTM
jgi:hypothetical protein